MQYLRQSTASQEISLGQFLDSTDGDTEENALTIANTDIKLRKHGTTTLANKNSGGATSISNGVYHATLDATDSNTLGMLEVYIHVAGALAVKDKYMVLPAAVFDYFVLGTGTWDSNMTAISGDTGAADNLEATYDGTGYTDDQAPAKQSQVTNLTVAGSASKVPALLSPNGFVITWGENEVNNEDATRPLDGTTHDIEAQNDGGTERIDTYYETNAGAGVPSEVTWHGRLDRGGGSAKNITIQVQDVDATTWRTISGAGGVASSSSLETHTFDIFINEVGTGGDLGVVRIRFLTGSVAFTSTTKLLTDQIFVSFNAGSVGSLDSIYFDSNASNTGTTSNDGIPGNPVSTEAAVNTLLTARNLNKIIVSVGSSITFATSHTGEEWKGDLWTLGLGGQNLANSLFMGAVVSGVHTGTGVRFSKGELGNMSTAGMSTDGCGHNGTITITASGTYIFNNDHSEVAGGNTPTIDTGALVGNVDLSMPDYHNGIELQNLNATGTDNFSISGIGQIIYAASSSGTVHQRGDWKATNTGGVTIIADDNTTKVDLIPTTAMRGTDGVDTASMRGTDGVDTATMRGTDSAATSAKQDTMETTLNAIPTTAMRGTDNAATAANLDILLQGLILQDTTIATLASQTSFTLTAGSADNNAYNGATIVVINVSTGTQKAFGSISDYVGSTKTVTLAQDPEIFTMAVTDKVFILSSDTFAIIDRLLLGSTHNIVNSFGRRVREVIDSVVLSSDTAQAGTINTITLAAAEPSVDGTYDPATVTIVAGKGFGQSRNALQYEGSTRILTVDRNWKETPDGTSVYAITSNAGREHVNEGLAQGGTSTTITLNALASSNNTAYPGQMAFIRSGTGDDQAKLILSYNGTTKVATINGTWDPIPDATSGYVILPSSPVMLSIATQTTIDSLATSAEIATLTGVVDDLAIKKNTALSNFEFLMVLTSDHATPATGLTVTGERSIDGGAFTVVSGTIAEVSNGIYQFDALAADTNGDLITWRFSEATADDTFMTFKTVQ